MTKTGIKKRGDRAQKRSRTIGVETYFHLILRMKYIMKNSDLRIQLGRGRKTSTKTMEGNLEQTSIGVEAAHKGYNPNGFNMRMERRFASRTPREMSVTPSPLMSPILEGVGA